MILQAQNYSTFNYGWQQRVMHKLLSKMTQGNLILTYSDGTSVCYGNQDKNQDQNQEISENSLSPQAEIQLIEDRDFFARCVAYGNIGLGEGYIESVWTTPDIKAVISWFIINMRHHMGAKASSSRLKSINKFSWLNKLFHLARANTIKNSKRNIAEHYDLGNEFYELFLDESMTYSSALFLKGNKDLAAAQTAKYEALCQKIQIQEGDKVLEIGCGWGGFAEYAAMNYGCHVIGVTISQAQFNYATQRIKQKGLEDLVEIRLQDYRHVQGEFDAIVSIEMLEAVGDKFLPDYFIKCNQLLKPQGALALQIITVPDCRYEALKSGTDFIQRHIFPGSLLLSLTRIAQVLKQTGELSLFDISDMGFDYATTLAQWHDNFNAKLPEVKQLGFDEAFIRKWNYYLKYCEAAFATKNISVVHAIYTKPNNHKLQSYRV